MGIAVLGGKKVSSFVVKH